MDMLTVDNQPVIQGIPLVVGENLLAQYSHLISEGKLVLLSDEESDINAKYLGHHCKIVLDNRLRIDGMMNKKMSESLPKTPQANKVIERRNAAMSFEKALQLTQQKHADIINALADK